MRVLFALISLLALSGPALAQSATDAVRHLTGEIPRLAEHLDRCDTGEAYACDYAIALLYRNDPAFWTSQENVGLQMVSCRNGSESACWKWERDAPVNPYAEVRATPELFVPMVIEACRNGSEMGCWQAAGAYMPGGSEPVDLTRARGYAADACERFFSDGCARLSDIEIMMGGTGIAAAARACNGTRPGQMRLQPYCERACEADDAAGCARVAEMHARGRDGYQGVTRDPTLAARYFSRACSLGDVASCEAGSGLDR